MSKLHTKWRAEAPEKQKPRINELAGSPRGSIDKKNYESN